MDEREEVKKPSRRKWIGAMIVIVVILLIAGAIIVGNMFPAGDWPLAAPAKVTVRVANHPLLGDLDQAGRQRLASIFSRMRPSYNPITIVIWRAKWSHKPGITGAPGGGKRLTMHREARSEVHIQYMLLNQNGTYAGKIYTAIGNGDILYFEGPKGVQILISPLTGKQLHQQFSRE